MGIICDTVSRTKLNPDEIILALEIQDYKVNII